jgi:hypothetical protein
MVTSRAVGLTVLLVVVVLGAAAQTDDGNSEKKGPTLYGDGGGRLWKWESGKKTFLTPEGRNAVLGGVGEKELWGWALEGDQARFFTQKLPQKEASGSGSKAMAALVFGPGRYPAPDRADRNGDRLLLVYGTRSGQPRWEVWQAGKQLAARAYDDGRLIYAAALSPQDGWIIAGRAADGTPWLEVSGADVEVPEGWRGRLTVAAWVPEAEKKDGEGADPAEKNKPAKRKAVHPWAAGWGAPGTESPRALLWGPEGWVQPDPSEDTPQGGVYPVVGLPGDGVLTLGGWRAEVAAGTLHPWFWDGKGAQAAAGTADGAIEAFSVKGKGGAFLIVRHPMAPWHTQEGGEESQVLDNLGPDDRVVVATGADAPGATPGP